MDILNIDMQENDADAKTVGEYLYRIIEKVLFEGESFSGKRPFGNSGWESELFVPLVTAGVCDGSVDEDGYLETIDECEAHTIVCEALARVLIGKNQ